MPANKNALIRYKTIDICLRKQYKKWTLDDLVEACSDALYEYEGVRKGVSLRTIQGDIQMMRSDKLGYNAPIEVYEQKYYRYADKDYSINVMPFSKNDMNVLEEAVDMLSQLRDFNQFAEVSDVVTRLQDKLAMTKTNSKPIMHFDTVPGLKGKEWINPLYEFISQKRAIKLVYQSFVTAQPHEWMFFPYLLKEYRNRWFVFGAKADNMMIYNLALDRIVWIEAVDIPYREKPEFDSEHFFDNIIGVSKSLKSAPRKIKFWANAEQSNYIKTKPLHPSQKLVSENLEDGSCVFRIVVVPNFEMYSTFMSYGAGVRILSPAFAVDYLRRQLTRALSQYGEADSKEA